MSRKTSSWSVRAANASLDNRPERRRPMLRLDQRSPASSWRLDAVGVAVLLLLGAWAVLFAGDGSGRSGPVLWYALGLVAVASIGRLLAGRPGLPSRAAASAVAGSIVLTWPGVLQAGGSPTGYANANATLTSLGLIAAIDASRTATSIAERRGWVALAGFLAACTAATGSVAGAVTVLVALSLAALSAWVRWPGFAIVGGAIAISIAVGATSAIAVGADLGGLEERAGRRGELWAAAADMIREEPLQGVGAGEFASRSPVSVDADLRWAHHGYLQVAAELGIVGLVLVLVLAAYMWLRLWRLAARAPAAAGLASAAVTTVGLHAAVDYVWHEPAVVFVAGFLVSASFASAGRSGDGRDEQEV